MDLTPYRPRLTPLVLVCARTHRFSMCRLEEEWLRAREAGWCSRPSGAEPAARHAPPYDALVDVYCGRIETKRVAVRIGHLPPLLPLLTLCDAHSALTRTVPRMPGFVLLHDRCLAASLYSKSLSFSLWFCHTLLLLSRHHRPVSILAPPSLFAGAPSAPGPANAPAVARGAPLA